jgi:UPF0755 protein
VRKWWIGVSTCALVLAGAATGLYVYVMNQIQGETAEESFQLTVEPGESLTQVLTKLEEKGLVGNAQWRYMYMRVKQPDYTYQAGEYYVEQGMNLEQVLSKLQNGEALKTDAVEVTIPEGWNVKQIANRLAENGLGDEGRYLDLFDDPDFYGEMRKKFTFLPPFDDKTKFPFEGYLFPETYHFAVDSTEEAVIERILTHTEAVIEDLATEYPDVVKKTDEVFTLASIVERETVLPEERAKVAGVFANRLEEEWKLESCATVQYILGKQRDRILYEDLDVEDSYNTYLHAGLPPGPIANPGRASLEAVLNPDEHNYFFFVTKKDGSNGHHFSETYEEHLQNDANSRGTW